MRIAFVANNSYAPWGGSEELWAQTALQLRRAGVPVLACVHNWQPPAPRVTALAAAGATVHLLRPKRWAAYRAGLRRIFRLRTASIIEQAIADVIAPFRPDLVVISQMMNLDGASWAGACAKANLPFALLAQAASDVVWPRDEEFDALRAVHSAARAIYFVSERNRRLTWEMLGARWTNTRIVSNPFLVGYDQPPQWPSPSGVYRMACVARLEPSAKGQDLLLRVLTSPRWRERPVEVSLFGRGPNSRALQAMAAQLDLPKVKFAGHVEDVATVWHHHHALLLPSRCEGTSLALIEAMLCHRPAIVTDVGGNAELVQDNVSGFVAASASQAAVEEAMERAWGRREEWREIGLAAGKRVRQCVPADPIAAFAEQLVAAAGQSA